MRYLIPLMLLPLLLPALTLEQIEKMPRSYAKDFYIWRYLDQNISSKEADAAFYQTKSVNWKILKRFAKKTAQPGFAEAVECRFKSAKNLPAESAECTAIAITPYKFTKLSKIKKFEVLKQLSHFPDELRWAEVMALEQPFYELVKQSDDIFFKIFNNCGSEWRERYLNHPLPPALIKRLSTKRGFAQTIKLIVTDKKLKTLQESLLGIDADKLSHQSTFFLAMNALRHGKKSLAYYYLKLSHKKAYYRFDKDKSLFWLAMIEPESEYLKRLSESFDLNIYSLYACEKLGCRTPRVATPTFKSKNSDYNISDPFAWLGVLRDIRGKKSEELIDYAKRFATSETLGHYCFIMERASRYKTHYFPMPYNEAYASLSTDKKALLLAIARQESRFIPSSISTSYALGMMQIMPFLVKALAKEKKEPLNLDSMFNPAKNIEYAITHLDYLQKYLHHPLFIAYAYNGGIGFTKRLLTERGVFKKGPYEPWLSMELVHYDESRRYGKKVLANYIVYKRLLGEPTSLESVVKRLTRPESTDRFRK
ncbi:MAG: lytic transglycosylase domain-containing protein [Hydrogenimonas sp.]|nr:lytic transglycosylase domain-containing protein [Hydrogenimonas sp.]